VNKYWEKRYKERTRKMSRKDRYTKKCKCGGFIPDEYTKCDGCFLGQFGFSVTYDALDHLCFKELIPQDEVLRLLRILKDGVFVTV